MEIAATAAAVRAAFLLTNPSGSGASPPWVEVPVPGPYWEMGTWRQGNLDEPIRLPMRS